MKLKNIAIVTRLAKAPKLNGGPHIEGQLVLLKQIRGKTVIEQVLEKYSMPFNTFEMREYVRDKVRVEMKRRAKMYKNKLVGTRAALFPKEA